jgi:hypothetical protein
MTKMSIAGRRPARNVDVLQVIGDAAHTLHAFGERQFFLAHRCVRLAGNLDLFPERRSENMLAKDAAG